MRKRKSLSLNLSFLFFASKTLRPSSAGMKDGENLDRVVAHPVGDDERCAVDDQLSGS